MKLIIGSLAACMFFITADAEAKETVEKDCYSSFELFNANFSVHQESREYWFSFSCKLKNSHWDCFGTKVLINSNKPLGYLDSTSIDGMEVLSANPTAFIAHWGDYTFVYEDYSHTMTVSIRQLWDKKVITTVGQCK